MKKYLAFYIILFIITCVTEAVLFAAPVKIRWPNLIGTDNVIISGGTIDNTVIGGTTPAAGTFTYLSVGLVDNTEIGYLNGVTSSIQPQLNLKAPIINPTFTNNVIVDNEVTALQYNSTGADNTHYINVANMGPPSSPAHGNQYYNKTDNVAYAYDNTAWRAQAVVVAAPSTSSGVCKPGMISFDATYVYICRATNTWMRASHATW